VLSSYRHCAQARLERRHVHTVLRIFPRFAQLSEQSQHRTDVFLLDAVCSAASRSRSSSGPWYSPHSRGRAAAQQCRGRQPFSRRGAFSTRSSNPSTGSSPSADAATSKSTSAITTSSAPCPAATTSARPRATPARSHSPPTAVSTTSPSAPPCPPPTPLTP